MAGKEKDNPVAVGEEIYRELAQEAPEREIDVPEAIQSKSLTEKMDETPSLSDLQFTISRLFPEFDETEMNELAKIAMVARVAPDVFSDLIYLVTVSLIQKQDPEKQIDVIGTLAKVYAIMSIGLDGKGRIDQIELHGAAKEEKELERLGRSIFEP